MYPFLKSYFLFIFLILLTGNTYAKETKLKGFSLPFCQRIFSKEYAPSIEISKIMQKKPFHQLRKWEQVSNTARWEKPTKNIPINFILLEPSEVKLNTIKDVPELVRLLEDPNTGKIRWYQHPNNSAGIVPYVMRDADGTINAQYSASRSMFVEAENDTAFSFKLPTNRPHPEPNTPPQPSKANLINDSILSIRRSDLINKVDKKKRKSRNFDILTEISSVSSVINGNGFSIRDLRPLKDGNFYLPAFSIPYAGKEIAKYLGQDFTNLWGKYYAKSLGKAKALLLTRYGLQMKTPNAQNWIIQLDKNLRPTGKIIMRDVADSNHVPFIANFNGSKDFLDLDIKDHYTIMSELKPNFANSVWQMDEGGLSYDSIEKWRQLHNEEYIRTIKSQFRITEYIDTIQDLENYLKTSEAEEKIRAFAARR